MKTVRKGILLLSVLIMLYSCDIYQSDTKPAFTDFGNIDVYTVDGNPSIIYSKAFFNRVYEPGLKFNITKQPSNGTILVLENGEYLQYQPDEESAVIDDQLSLDIVSSEGKGLGKANVRFLSTPGCGRGPVPTHVQTSKGQPIQIDFLDNDIFCGPLIDPADNGPFMLFDENGNWLNGFLENWNSLPTSNGTLEFIYVQGKFVIQYTPDEGFIGTDIIYWGCFEGYIGENVNDGEEDVVFFADYYWEHPEWWEKYYVGRLELEVTE